MQDLLTADQAAACLGICTRTLREHVRAGELAFIPTGRGPTRQRRMFHPADLDAFIDNRRRYECPPIALKANRTSDTTSSYKAIDFKALRAAQRDEKRRHLKRSA